MIRSGDFRILLNKYYSSLVKVYLTDFDFTKAWFPYDLKESATSAITIGNYLHRKIADGCRHNRHVFPFI